MPETSDRRNPNERAKDALDPLDLRPRLDRYAREGFDAIDPDDLTIRFRWWGLYTQRPAEDHHFMLRIRIPGGALTSRSSTSAGSSAGQSPGTSRTRSAPPSGRAASMPRRAAAD